MHASDGTMNLSMFGAVCLAELTEGLILSESSDPLHECMIALVGACLEVCSRAAKRALG